MISVRNLEKIYGSGDKAVHAIKNANFEIKKGEIFGVIGFSGAGKSSLIRCINLLERPTSGEIIVNGTDLTKLSSNELRKARRKIGMIFQHFNLLSSSTVFDNVAAPLKLSKAPKDVIQKKVTELLEVVGLSKRAHAYPSQLSGGQKQRVAIARALANDPEILLCDEATSALDPQTTESILDLLLDINKKYNLTIMLITHEMHVVKKICDRVAVMEEGKIVEMGSVLDIFSRPQTATTKNFIRNIFDDELPPGFLERVQHAPGSRIVRLTFIGESTEQPVLAELTEKFHLKPNIMFGHITQIKDTTFGYLVISLTGEASVLDEALQYVKEQGIHAEVIHHV
ncbi:MULTISPECIES: methionine ABC transporter ATP-binding protein [Aneurinibacillus]|uniref:D-methionine transport system ATP-binding protein n=1 Tax=Aneurinibacillus thermoaerophilus TaxID=143495 RepID=A0A1G8ATX3_ANETH|nr:MULTISPECIES: methionine ABC transporter ATP-binding protein [Aneurinibacillus]AMA72838.1 methionine ABC transporter ATP-binding protein [Aneurinibacillus sp. XH2]MED0675224.1 methionine ABC transporter ATP-binding protein [Aneurinibacillus thermoaerophilus]MED0680080.1 methionine ABC transporter ATP-binding protein [Aneurinibacillus thermoaerophilus]MED0738162.1 methionine ABC transporter ATP-binding protein [Aneurinibacillus thermoaerophilus]MED0758220.1 methionine ABC transporter ATP-bin